MSDAGLALPRLRRILAVKLADLGDLLTVTPALQALRAAYPLARIDLLVPSRSAHLLQGAPYLDGILQFDKFAYDSPRGILSLPGLIRTAGFLARVRALRYDALIFFHHFTTRWGALKFDLVALASGAPTRAGLDNGRIKFLTNRVMDLGFGTRHEVDYWLSVAGLLGADPYAGWLPTVPVDEPARATADRLLGESGRNRANPLVAVHPGVGSYSPARKWPVERFAQVARGLIESQDARIVIVGGPEEQELTATLHSLIGDAARTLNLAGRTTVHETAAVIERCALLVGNDSGPMHIAVAVKTPVVAIYGPSNWKAWGPYSPPETESIHTIVARDLPCMPCFYRGHSLGLKEGCGPRPCLSELPSEIVLAACTASLAKQSARSTRRPGKLKEILSSAQ